MAQIALAGGRLVSATAPAAALPARAVRLPRPPDADRGLPRRGRRTEALRHYDALRARLHRASASCPTSSWPGSRVATRAPDAASARRDVRLALDRLTLHHCSLKLRSGLTGRLEKVRVNNGTMTGTRAPTVRAGTRGARPVLIVACRPPPSVRRAAVGSRDHRSISRRRRGAYARPRRVAGESRRAVRGRGDVQRARDGARPPARKAAPRRHVQVVTVRVPSPNTTTGDRPLPRRRRSDHPGIAVGVLPGAVDVGLLSASVDRPSRRVESAR